MMRIRGHSDTILLHRLLGSKIAVAIIIFVLVCSFVIGSTVAWLVSKTDPVVNTFTYGDINITLTETDTGDNDGDPNTNDYIMIPGNSITKDPKVTVRAGSEACRLFVKADKSANFDTFMEYAMADGWIVLEGETGVYYREVAKSIEAQEFSVILENTVTVKGEGVTKVMLNALTAETLPMLTVTAYAVQKDNIATAAAAWALAEAN